MTPTPRSAPEVIGNAADENCDGVIAPYPPLVGSIRATWKKRGKHTRNVTLLAKGFPESAQIAVVCTGVANCPKQNTVARVSDDRPARRPRQPELLEPGPQAAPWSSSAELGLARRRRALQGLRQAKVT
jgi:hypothetical protein